MTEPLFWLGLSILLVAVSLTAVLAAALPAFRELARASRSAEKFFDTLSRELPPTLEAIRLTGLEITDLTDDVSEGIQSANRVAKQVDQSLVGVKRQARKAQVTTRSVVVGFKAAWRAFQRSTRASRRPGERLPVGDRSPLEFNEYDDRQSEPGLEQPSPVRGADRTLLALDQELEQIETEWNERSAAIDSRSAKFSQLDYED